MHASPTVADVWLATRLAALMGQHPLFDLGVQSGINHAILGGAWFGAVLFFWFFRLRTHNAQDQLKFEVTVLGSLLATALAGLATFVVEWPAPNKAGMLAARFPDYILRSPVWNCFPSYSTAVYSSIAAGVFWWRRQLGIGLWIAVVVVVALPRMYVGGHYLSDVLVGAVCGLTAFATARFIMSHFRRPLLSMQAGEWHWLLTVIVFVYVWQVSVEFREVAWFWNSLRYFIPWL